MQPAPGTGRCSSINSVVLDAGPLGRLARRRPAQDISDWLMSLLEAEVFVLVPEVADFEVRRELLAARLIDSIAALDRLKADLITCPSRRRR